MSLKNNSVEQQINVYLKLIEVTFKTKREFEVEIHPEALTKFHNRHYGITVHLVSLVLDLIKIPKKDIHRRQLYYDLIVEHIERKTITKEHLLEMLISWEDHDIIEQAE